MKYLSAFIAIEPRQSSLESNWYSGFSKKGTWNIFNVNLNLSITPKSKKERYKAKSTAKCYYPSFVKYATKVLLISMIRLEIMIYRLTI